MGRLGRGLRAKILRSVFATVALPAFSLMVAFYVGWNAYVRERIKVDVAASTEAIALRIGGDLAAYDALLERLAADPSVAGVLSPGGAEGEAGARGAAAAPESAMRDIYDTLRDRGVAAVITGVRSDGSFAFGTRGPAASLAADGSPSGDWGIYGLLRRDPGRTAGYQRGIQWGPSVRTDWAIGRAVADGRGGIAGYLFADLAFRDSADLQSGPRGVTGRFILANEFDRVVAAYDGSSLGPFARFSIDGERGETTLAGARYAFRACEAGRHGLRVYGLASIEFIVSSFRFGLWTIAVIIVLSSAVFVLVLSRSVSRLTRPMDAMLATMAEVSRGDFGARLDVISGDEFEELATRLNDLIAAMGDTVQRQLEGVELAKAAEMKQLQAQFDPHFLYNTIDTARWMIRMGEADKAQAMLADMAKVLRYSVQDRPAGALTSLREDLQVIRTYVDIHRLSLGERLEVAYDIDESVLSRRVPKLLIQPLVENALMHGISAAGGGRLLIAVRGEGEETVIRVEDTGTGFDVDLAALERRAAGAAAGPGAAAAQDAGTGFGLGLVLRRARLQYGPRFSFDVQSGKGRGTVVTLRLPAVAGEG